MADGLYEEWKSGKIGAHQIMALLSAFHKGQVNAAGAIAVMDAVGLSATAKTQMQTVYNKLVAGTLDREELDNAFMLGDRDYPGFSTKAEFLASLGI